MQINAMQETNLTFNIKNKNYKYNAQSKNNL